MMKQKTLTIVHVIAGFSPENHGIMEAALATAEILRTDFSIESELWFPEKLDESHQFDMRGAEQVSLAKGCDVVKLAEDRSLDQSSTVVVTHGCWRLPTIVGARLKRAGYAWVYVPHGMLEPWSRSQKFIKKWLYWHLREQRMALLADVVRATSIPERVNLQHMLPRVSLISHGVSVHSEPKREGAIRSVLFMGRLHPKKGASNLAKAWTLSALHNNDKYRLIIVGSDDGDLPTLAGVMEDTPSNIELREPVYGSAKEELFNDCQFFALPSHSEGLPMALLEGMAAGLVPILSEGCNLPKALESGFSVKVSPDVESVVAGLNEVFQMDNGEIDLRSEQTRRYIEDEYSLHAIAGQQAELYRSLSS